MFKETNTEIFLDVLLLRRSFKEQTNDHKFSSCKRQLEKGKWEHLLNGFVEIL